MKTKLISKILCGVLAGMTIASGGMMYAGAYNVYRFSLTDNTYCEPQPKFTASSVYVKPITGGTLQCRIYEGQSKYGTFYDSDGGDYTISQGNYEYLTNYVYEDGCSYAAIYGWDYGLGYVHGGDWMPDC